jgi:hypothetical protein
MTANRSTLTTLVCCGIAASAGIASAEEVAAPAPPEVAAPAPPEAAPPAPPDGVVAPVEDPAAAPAARWPRAVIARPLTLPGGLAQLGMDVTANTGDSTVLAMNVIGYGITDDLEATAFYAFSLKDFEVNGSFDIDVGYKLARGALDGKLEVIARGRAGYSALDETANPLRLGAHVQYNVTDKLALITPGQQLVLELAEDMAGDRPVLFQLPVAVGFQAASELYLQLDTTLAQIASSGNALFGADTTPIALTAVYNAIPALDVLAAISLNLTPPESTDPMAPTPGVGDTLAFLIGARYYLGKL